MQCQHIFYDSFNEINLIMYICALTWSKSKEHFVTVGEQAVELPSLVGQDAHISHFISVCY
jgi:hypothetical protein